MSILIRVQSINNILFSILPHLFLILYLTCRSVAVTKFPLTDFSLDDTWMCFFSWWDLSCLGQYVKHQCKIVIIGTWLRSLGTLSGKLSQPLVEQRASNIFNLSSTRREDFLLPLSRYKILPTKQSHNIINRTITIVQTLVLVAPRLGRPLPHSLRAHLTLSLAVLSYRLHG